MRKTPIYLVAEREIKHILCKKITFFFLIIFPVLLFVTYASVYSVRSLQNLPVAVLDSDHSALSRTLIRSIESNSSFDIKETPSSFDEIKDLMEERSIYAAFVIPHDFEKDIKSGKKVNVVVYKNATNIVVSNLVLKNATTVIRTVSAGVVLKKIQSKGNSYERSYNIANALKIDSHPLYNPFYNYENYIVPGLLVFTLQMIVMLGASIVLNGEVEEGKIKQLLSISKHNAINILTGKFLAHFIVNSVSAIALTLIIFPLFKIPVFGSLPLVILFVLMFNAVCISLGFMISAVFHERLLASEIAVAINTPTFIFSGFTFPIWGMPTLHSVIANILPFTHFLSGFLKLYQMDAPISAVLPEIGILSVFLLGSMIVTYLFFNKTISSVELAGNEG